MKYNVTPKQAALAAIEVLRKRLEWIEESVNENDRANYAPLCVSNELIFSVEDEDGRLSVETFASMADEPQKRVTCDHALQLAGMMLHAISTDSIQQLTMKLCSIGYSDHEVSYANYED